VELIERIKFLIQLIKQAIEKQVHVFNVDKNHYDLAFAEFSYNFSPEPALRWFGFTSGLVIPQTITILEDTYEEMKCFELQLYGQVKWQEYKTLLFEKWAHVNKELRKWQTQYAEFYDYLIIIIYNSRIMLNRVYCATTIVAGIATAENYVMVCNLLLLIYHS
jgi:hypothetical protein